MRVLDVGCGAEPLPMATTVVEVPWVSRECFKPGNREVVWADVCTLPFPDKWFDFVWCSHCVEHSANPGKAFDELSRVGVAGMVMVPSALAELFERLYNPTDCAGHHFWMFRATSNELLFTKVPDCKEDIEGVFMAAKIASSWHGYRTELRLVWGPDCRCKKILWNELTPEEFGRRLEVRGDRS